MDIQQEIYFQIVDFFQSSKIAFGVPTQRMVVEREPPQAGEDEESVYSMRSKSR